jgi:hypothetical protein
MTLVCWQLVPQLTQRIETRGCNKYHAGSSAEIKEGLSFDFHDPQHSD